MFARWKERKRRRPAVGYGQGAGVQCAVIVDEGAQMAGKPVQQITYLGSITESAVEAPAQHAFFWQGIMKTLGWLREWLKRDRARMARIDAGAAERDRIPYQ